MDFKKGLLAFSAALLPAVACATASINVYSDAGYSQLMTGSDKPQLGATYYVEVSGVPGQTTGANNDTFQIRASNSSDSSKSAISVLLSETTASNTYRGFFSTGVNSDDASDIIGFSTGNGIVVKGYPAALSMTIDGDAGDWTAGYYEVIDSDGDGTYTGSRDANRINSVRIKDDSTYLYLLYVFAGVVDDTISTSYYINTETFIDADGISSGANNVWWMSGFKDDYYAKCYFSTEGASGGYFGSGSTFSYYSGGSYHILAAFETNIAEDDSVYIEAKIPWAWLTTATDALACAFRVINTYGSANDMYDLVNEDGGSFSFMPTKNLHCYLGDVTPPVIRSVTAADNATINVIFNEELSASNASVYYTNYTVNSVPVESAVVSSNMLTLTLSNSRRLSINTAYTVSLPFVKDTAGNYDAYSETFTYFGAVSASGAVVGASGGVIQASDGALLIIPAGALNSDVRITFTPAANILSSCPDSEGLISSLHGGYIIEPQSVLFSDTIPAMIYTYASASISADLLSYFYYDGIEWILLGEETTAADDGYTVDIRSGGVYCLASSSATTDSADNGLLASTPDYTRGIDRSVFTPNGDGFYDIASFYFQLMDDAHVEICIYDLYGRVIATVFDGNLDGGEIYSMPWDGKNDSGEKVEAGAYYYRIRATRESAVIGMNGTSAKSASISGMVFVIY